jgi:hypothetical protein
MFTKKLGELWMKTRGVSGENSGSFGLKLWEFFCEHNGGIFGKYRTIWFSFLTKQQEHGKKSVKMYLTFFSY